MVFIGIELEKKKKTCSTSTIYDDPSEFIRLILKTRERIIFSTVSKDKAYTSMEIQFFGEQYLSQIIIIKNMYVREKLRKESTSTNDIYKKYMEK